LVATERQGVDTSCQSDGVEWVTEALRSCICIFVELEQLVGF